jgi:GTP cyclohydrolase III
MDMLYLAVDGDDVGHRIEYFMLINEAESLASFSATFQSAMSWLKEELANELGATIIMCGGDNLLASVPPDSCLTEIIERIRTDFAERVQSTLSIGLAKTPREAYLALKLAKASGKDRIQRA